MELPIKHATWGTLRACLRHQMTHRTDPAGFSLRVGMTRATKDCAHLPDLVAAGLLEVVKAGPTPAESTYRLTERGKIAAEYGTFQADHFPPKPV